MHCVAERIEKSLDNKLSPLGIFISIDLEGTLDKPTFNSITNTIQRHQYNHTGLDGPICATKSRIYFNGRYQNQKPSHSIELLSC